MYAYDEILTDDQVSHGVVVEGVDVSRMSQPQATAAIATYEAELANDPVNVVVDGHTLVIVPADVGFDIDEEAVVSEAMVLRRSSNGFSNFFNWIGTRFGSETFTIEPTIDDEAVEALFADWNLTRIDKPAYDGAVIIVDGLPAAEYPQAGTRIETEESTELVLAAASGDLAEPVELPLTDIEPVVTRNDVENAVLLARQLVEDPIVLRGADPSNPMLYSQAALVSALRTEVIVNSPAQIDVYLDDETLVGFAATLAPLHEVPATPASFEFDDVTKQISVVPSVLGETVDLEAIPAVVAEAALGSRVGVIPMMPGPEPELNTEAAEAMGPFGEVSTFTTYHPCCASRVVNIQLLADEIDNHWVLPGETFSINETAGQRTLAEGYQRAGAIIGGRIECCDSAVNIGGGTSQFATTFYNAIFFGCYEDVFHQPHSIYFSRYPYVREATLGYPSPDVKFRNDSESVIFIDTSYTGSSITVTFYGNNGGRICTSERDGNTITRVMTHPDGTTTTQSWSWNYKPELPPTTTTTKPAPTTTTIPAPPTTVVTTTTVAPPPPPPPPPDTTTTTAAP
jgi:vancomycin resistance protein YoaR